MTKEDFLRRADMQRALDRYPWHEIRIWSGEVEGGVGSYAVFRGRRTVRAIRRRLNAERCGGDRWARAMLEAQPGMWFNLED